MTFIKCVVVGDGGVGKTCLLIRYTNKVFPGEYIPTVFDNYAANLMVGGQCVSLTLIDTAGQEEYERLRVNSYLDADVILICFSIAAPSSFDAAIKMWTPEVRSNCPNAHILLIGTQLDRRDQSVAANTVPEVQGHAAKQQIGALRYIECSALTNENVSNVFDQAINVCLKKRRVETKKKSRKCQLL